MKLQEIVQLDFDIVVVDGLRIGGSGGDLEIGATIEGNLTVVRDAATGEPYIPGSSLKGKLRSLTEKVDGTFDKQRGISNTGLPCQCGTYECRVCPVYGAHMNTRALCAPTRIKVRDSHLTADSKIAYKKILQEWSISGA
jgi:CRISPR-associated protein Csm3